MSHTSKCFQHVAASHDEAGTKAIMINDVARALFEAKATRALCVELPDEDRLVGQGEHVEEGDHGHIGREVAEAS